MKAMNARKVFRIPRLSEFASLTELARLIGHATEQWLEAALKELIDNALDDCEEHGLAPVVKVDVDAKACTLTVEDNGAGVPPEIVDGLADLSNRLSSREAYVSPTRGAQGNAWQTLMAMPFAFDNDAPGEAAIETRGIHHRLRIVADPIDRIPRVEHDREPSAVKKGARATLRWPVSARSLLIASKWRFLSCAVDFSWLNPHLALTVTWDGEREIEAVAIDEAWKKWLPRQPESPHWYNIESFVNRIIAEIRYARASNEPDPFVRDFIGQFRGLRSTVKQAEICDYLGASKERLSDFYRGGEAGRERASNLLVEMQIRTNPIKPLDLGFIGRDNLMTRAAGFCDLDSFQYRREAFELDGFPYVAEVAFAYAPGLQGRHSVAGLNFSPVVGGHPFRQLSESFGEQHIGPGSPVMTFMHLTSPRFAFVDKGKASVWLKDEVVDRMKALIVEATKKWRKQAEAEIRTENASVRREERLACKQPRAMTKKDAAYQVMEEAYMRASNSATLPANARQVFYPARDLMLPLIGKSRDVDDNYFTQTLLPDFIADHPELTQGWDVVFDDRGGFIEPHTGFSVGLGTLNVRDYVERFEDPKATPARLAEAFIDTVGPKGRFSAVLFIEKEGFDHLMQAARIRERYDVAVMSTKGFSNTAARKLIDVIVGRLGLKLFVLHDFDIAGFGIKHTLINDGRRYAFEHAVECVDLGLRLSDVDRMALTAEPVRAQDETRGGAPAA
jgi:hypothetical protein